MGMFLNSNAPYEGYREVLRDVYFVDKSLFLSELIPSLGKRNRFFLYHTTSTFWQDSYGKYGWGIFRENEPKG